MDKHFSLSRKFVNYGEKKFKTMVPGDTTTILIMTLLITTLLIMTLLIMTILITLNTSGITQTDNT